MPRAFKTPVYTITSESKMAIPPFTYCVRKPNIKRRLNEKSNYKKGIEIRISLNNIEETNLMRTLLRKKSINSGNPFKKHKRIILPIYGKENAIKILNRISRTRNKKAL